MQYYDIEKLLNYNEFTKIINNIKQDKNDIIHVNIYTAMNDENVDTLNIDTYTDIIDVYNMIKEIYAYNDINMYVQVSVL